MSNLIPIFDPAQTQANPLVLPSPESLIRPKRAIHSIVAALLPWTPSGIQWAPYFAQLEKIVGLGMVPAINMDTGHANLLSREQRTEILGKVRDHLRGVRFVAGAYLGDAPGSAFDPGAYGRAMEEIQNHGGIPILFPSHGMGTLQGEALVRGHETLAQYSDAFYGFELSQAFVPFGRIFTLAEFEGLLNIPALQGAKHSSLSRIPEWERLVLRDRVRPDFKLFTGNDLAIDMVIYGSDYLLGLAAFAPDMFALRDRWWLVGDARFYELNDALQALGAFAFRDPVPAYKHSAIQFWRIRGWLHDDRPAPGAVARSESDLMILAKLWDRLAPFAEFCS